MVRGGSAKSQIFSRSSAASFGNKVNVVAGTEFFVSSSVETSQVVTRVNF